MLTLDRKSGACAKLFIAGILSLCWQVEQLLQTKLFTKAMKVYRLVHFPSWIKFVFTTLKVDIICNDNGHFLAMVHSCVPVFPGSLVMVAKKT